MTDTDLTREDGETFIEFQKRVAIHQALAAQRQARVREDSLAQILRVQSYAVTTVIDLTGGDDRDADTGTYVVRTDERGRDTYWQAVVNGRRTGTMFNTRPHAVLHALAVESGEDGDSGFYAARVLGLPDDAPAES